MSEKHFFGIAQGVHTGVKHIHKFGYNPSVGSNYEDIWSRSGKIVFETSAAVATIDSNLANSGCDIEIQGLDGNYNEVTETVTLDSSGDATTTQTFLRINRAFVSGNTAISNVVRIYGDERRNKITMPLLGHSKISDFVF